MTDKNPQPIDSNLWRQVDTQFEQSLLGDLDTLDAALRDSVSAGLPAISVSPSQGKFLQLLCRACHAHRILEIGTLGGYSAIWMAAALPDKGRLITLEIDPKHAAVANGNLKRAGLADKVEVRLGPALDSLRQMHAEAAEPFDLIFIDADKENIPNYYEASLKLARAGTVIVVDNVVRGGEILNPTSPDKGAHGVRALLDHLATDLRVSATAIQTVGSKGYDGFLLALVR